MIRLFMHKRIDIKSKGSASLPGRGEYPPLQNAGIPCFLFGRAASFLPEQLHLREKDPASAEDSASFLLHPGT